MVCNRYTAPEMFENWNASRRSQVRASTFANDQTIFAKNRDDKEHKIRKVHRDAEQEMEF